MPPPPPLSLCLLRGVASPSSPRPPSMRRAGARGNATTPAIRFTYQRAGGRRPRRAFPGKMELRWVAWYALWAAEAAVVALKRPGIQGMRRTEAGEEGADRKRESRRRALSPIPIPSLPSTRLDTRLDPLFTARVLFGRICRKESATSGQMRGLDRNFMHTRNKSAGTCTPKKAVLQLALHFSYSFRKSEAEY